MTTKEFEFFLKADLSRYNGKYIIIIDDKVVASGDTAKIWEEVKKKFPYKKSMLAKIPTDDTLIYEKNLSSEG